MFTFITNIPIARRLFYAFFLATMIPAIVIFILGATFINAQNTQSHWQNSATMLIIAVSIAITVLLIAGIGYVVYLTITRPLGQLSTLTTRIAKGDTNARANISGHDEIYIVANSMNNMLDNIVRLIQETQSQRDTLQAQFEELVSEVRGIGERNLSIKAKVTS